MISHVGFREERIRTISNYELSTLVQHSYMDMANTRSLCIWILKDVKVELNNKIKKKKVLSGLAVLKSFLCVCEKPLVIFVISKFFFADQCSQTIGSCQWPTVIGNADCDAKYSDILWGSSHICFCLFLKITFCEKCSSWKTGDICQFTDVKIKMFLPQHRWNVCMFVEYRLVYFFLFLDRACTSVHLFPSFHSSICLSVHH